MAGDEVLNCYGPNYKLMSRSERQIALKQQYCFECQCDKCITDDKTRMKYYEYICTKKDCENRRIVDVDDQNWWHHLDNHSHIHNMFYKFYCNECDTYLITPQLLTLCQMIENQEVLDPAAMIACWVNGSRALSKNHELRAVLAQGILRRSNMHGLFMILYSGFYGVQKILSSINIVFLFRSQQFSRVRISTSLPY